MCKAKKKYKIYKKTFSPTKKLYLCVLNEQIIKNTKMEIKSYNFSNIKFSDLENLVSIRPQYNSGQFDDWFNYQYEINATENSFFEQLIAKHILLLNSYFEDTLKAKFIIPILNLVDFNAEYLHDWYHASLSGEINGVEINGFTDYMVASGTREPRQPYFFIQEFKPSIPDKDPEIQLLAEMLVTIEKNQTNIMRGGYIIGQSWKFVILEKTAENKFQYFVSSPFDALNLDDLKKIYIILQAVKHKYCKD